MIMGDDRARGTSAIDDLNRMAEVMLWGGRDALDGDELRIWRGRRLTMYRYRGGFSFRRGKEYLADAFAANLALSFVHDGELSATSDGQTSSYRRGEVAAFRMDRPLESRTATAVAMTIMHIPLRLLESRGIDTRQLAGRTWQASVLCEAVMTMANSVFHGANEAEALVLEAGVTELLIGMLATQGAVGRVDDVTEQTRVRALQYIDENYTEVDLDADRIAAALGTSRRYLYGLFEGRGPSIATLIRDRRTAHAEQLLLTEPTFSIRRIAHLSGFGSEDRLLRSFKQMTGVSPSAYRRSVVAGEPVLVSS